MFYLKRWLKAAGEEIFHKICAFLDVTKYLLTTCLRVCAEQREGDSDEGHQDSILPFLTLWLSLLPEHSHTSVTSLL